MIFCDLGLNVGVKVNLYIFLHYLLSGIILLVTEMELINLSWKIYFSQFLFMFNLLVLNSSGIFLKKNNSTILVMNKNSLDNIWIIYLHMLKPRYNSIPCIQHVLSVCYWIKEIGNQNLLWFSPLYEKNEYQKLVLYYCHQITFEIPPIFNTVTVICEAMLCASTKSDRGCDEAFYCYSGS